MISLQVFPEFAESSIASPFAAHNTWSATGANSSATNAFEKSPLAEPVTGGSAPRLALAAIAPPVIAPSVTATPTNAATFRTP